MPHYPVPVTVVYGEARGLAAVSGAPCTVCEESSFFFRMPCAKIIVIIKILIVIP